MKCVRCIFPSTFVSLSQISNYIFFSLCVCFQSVTIHIGIMFDTHSIRYEWMKQAHYIEQLFFSPEMNDCCVKNCAVSSQKKEKKKKRKKQKL